jgi:hypothetical protein
VAINVQRHEEDIFFTDAVTGNLYEVLWNSQSGQWVDMGVLPNTGPLGSEPNLAVWPPGSDLPAGQQDVFWRSNGTNTLVEDSWYNGWGGWKAIAAGAGHVGSAPTVAINVQRHEEDIFFTDAVTGGLYEVIWNSQGRQWFDMGVVPNTAILGSEPSLAVWPPGSDLPAGQQDVFWRSNGTNTLVEDSWYNGWGGWKAIAAGAGHVGSAPTVAINVTLHQEDIFFKDAVTGSLYEVYWYAPSRQWYDMKVVPNSGLLG